MSKQTDMGIEKITRIYMSRKSTFHMCNARKYIISVAFKNMQLTTSAFALLCYDVEAPSVFTYNIAKFYVRTYLNILCFGQVTAS